MKKEAWAISRPADVGSRAGGIIYNRAPDFPVQPRIRKRPDQAVHDSAMLDLRWSMPEIEKLTSVRTAQLAEQVEGDDRRLAAVELHHDGCVHVAGLDSGTKVRNFWGNDDYEYWVRVPAEELGKLAFHLLRQRYSEHPDAVAEFRAFCEKNEIAHDFNSWF